MFCSNCGNQVAEDAKFCEACGHQVGQSASPSGGSVTANSEKPNEYISKGKEVSSAYFNVFVKQLKSPFYEARQLHEDKMMNGLMTFVLLAISISLTFFIIANNVARGLYDGPSFGSIFFGGAVSIVVMLFLVSLVIFVTLKIMRVETSYGVVVNRLGSLLSISLLISLIAVFFAIVQVNVMANFILYFAYLTASIAIFAVIFSFDRNEKGGIDPVYGVMIASVGTALVFTFVFMVVMASFVDNLLF
ncbi:membrane-associated HD superfamily phosphohydrolase [Alkalibacillus flavidus]|uniref:Membrane-associated HD superfamily phosphohydrolase n=1 Tax=Alkalibacillus flavidus TaxID=546021 RepID=A0ABV2KU27_9BACI